jgi:hypothetical protein
MEFHSQQATEHVAEHVAASNRTSRLKPLPGTVSTEHVASSRFPAPCREAALPLKPLPGTVVPKQENKLRAPAELDLSAASSKAQVRTPLSKSNRVHTSSEEDSPERHQRASSPSAQGTVQEHTKKKTHVRTSFGTRFDGSAQVQTASCAQESRPASTNQHDKCSNSKPEDPKPRRQPENPKGFVHWPTDKQQKEFEESILTQRHDKALLCVNLPIKKSTFTKTSAHILRVPADQGKCENFANVHLIRYFVDKVWKLPRPEVLISVTGGAKHFDLSPEHKDRMMRGMMEGTRQLNPWSCVCVCVCVFVRGKERER